MTISINADTFTLSPLAILAAIIKALKARVGGKCSETYNTWRGMLARTRNANASNYKNYGGRGITVCAAWSSFASFVLDMGIRPEGTTIDRIDVNGNYIVSNCRWATAKEQAANKR